MFLHYRGANLVHCHDGKGYFKYYSFLLFMTSERNIIYAETCNTTGLKSWCLILHSAGFIFSPLTSPPKAGKVFFFFLICFFWLDCTPHNRILHASALPRANHCANTFLWCECHPAFKSDVQLRQFITQRSREANKQTKYSWQRQMKEIQMIMLIGVFEI